MMNATRYCQRRHNIHQIWSRKLHTNTDIPANHQQAYNNTNNNIFTSDNYMVYLRYI